MNIKKVGRVVCDGTCPEKLKDLGGFNLIKNHLKFIHFVEHFW
jgi:hypothetical protein